MRGTRAPYAGLYLLLLAGAVGAENIFQYRNLGTNIECSASAFADGRTRLQLTVEHSSIASVVPKVGSGASGESASGPASAWLRHPPAFRTTYGHFQLDLRDGQSAQAFLGAAVDGEVVTLDVTLKPAK